ncbi:MAG: dihydroorotase [Robiginitomaculum sp.]|nr:MAG: dihydroorotase [Robiginitomaculum sp.]
MKRAQAEPLIISGARVIDPACGRDDVSDVLIENGRIAALETSIKKEGVKRIDASGLVLAPGLIDVLVKTGEPGAEQRETLRSVGKAAAAGGVTSLVISPQSDPAIDDPAMVDFIKRRGRKRAAVRILPAGGLTKGLKGTLLAEIGLMKEAGAVLFSNGDQPIGNAAVMRNVLTYAKGMGALVSNRPIEPDLCANGVMNAGDYAARLGLSGLPAVGERIMVERDIALCEASGASLLIDQISTGAALDAVRCAKARGVDVFCSVSIYHLTLNELDVGDYRTFARLSPPLRSETDRKALIEGVSDGTIDAVVSGHDPRPAEEKRLPFAQSSPGAVGVETLLSGALSLVHNDEVSLCEALRVMSTGPARMLGLKGGSLAVGAPADLVVFDPDCPWVCDAMQLRSKSKNTPYDGRRMQGRAIMTFVDGACVFNQD